MHTDYTGQSARQVGDINLAAALMACGIPLDERRPVKIIDSATTEHPYASWRVTEASADGKHTTDACNGHWSGKEMLPPHHPFAVICDFIRARPAGKLTVSDWLDHAIDYLADQGVSLPGLRGYDDIEQFIAALPTAPESYILAFVGNRRTCLQLYREASRSVYMTRGQSHAMIDANLPRWQQKEILSRLQG